MPGATPPPPQTPPAAPTAIAPEPKQVAQAAALGSAHDLNATGGTRVEMWAVTAIGLAMVALP